MKLSLVLIFLSVIVTGCGQTISVNELSNLQASQLLPLSNALKALYRSNPKESSAIRNIEYSVIEKIVILRSVETDISKLGVPTIKGLCSIIDLQTNKSWGAEIKDKSLLKIVNGYLISVRAEAAQRANQLPIPGGVKGACAT